MFKLILSTVFISTLSAKAAVWTTDVNRQWTTQDEQNFSQFVKNEVTPDFFKKLGSPFSDLKLDCADAHYGLRIYYAWTNDLPFYMGNKYYSNTTTMFDKFSDAKQRVAQFIYYVVENNGVENLAHSDTFPVAIKNIKPGDIFLYKIESSPGMYSRHTYIIKNIRSNGTLDVLYSTQARKKAGLPMNIETRFVFKNNRWIPNHTGSDKNSYGFRRLKTPQNYSIPTSSIPDANYEQYALATQLGDNFFDYVKNQLATTQETPEELMTRMYESICHELYERVEVVNLGLEYRKKINNTCMNPQDYDTYSTPSRDGGILGGYSSLKQKSDNLKSQGLWNQVNADLQTKIDIIFTGARDSGSLAIIQKSCGFFKAQNLATDMAQFYDALVTGKASYHPNDSLFNRWGIQASGTAAPTTCPRY